MRLVWAGHQRHAQPCRIAAHPPPTRPPGGIMHHAKAARADRLAQVIQWHCAIIRCYGFSSDGRPLIGTELRIEEQEELPRAVTARRATDLGKARRVAEGVVGRL